MAYNFGMQWVNDLEYGMFAKHTVGWLPLSCGFQYDEFGMNNIVLRHFRQIKNAPRHMHCNDMKMMWSWFCFVFVFLKRKSQLKYHTLLLWSILKVLTVSCPTMNLNIFTCAFHWTKLWHHQCAPQKSCVWMRTKTRRNSCAWRLCIPSCLPTARYSPRPL